MADGRLSPFVYWAQTETNISLKIDLKNVTAPEVHLNEDELEFNSSGFGACGQNEYHFVLEFFQPINPKESQFRISDRQVDFNIKKQKKESWPKLISQNKKPAWLKIDFDKWTPDDDDDDLEENDRDFYNDQKDLFDKWKTNDRLTDNYKMTLQNFRKLYLCLYNIFQCFGFIFIFTSLLTQYIKEGPDCTQRAYETVGWYVKISHCMQIMEIVHRFLKYTRGSFKEILIQVIGHLFIIFVMIEGEPRIQNKPVIFYLFCVWSLIEIVKYAYYIFRVYKIDIGLITWLRYTIWIPLYPLAFFLEGIITLRNIPYFEETKRFSIALPNKWNFSFDLPSLLRIYLLCFLFPTMYVMMNYMYRQRKRKIGPKEKIIRKCD